MLALNLSGCSPIHHKAGIDLIALETVLGMKLVQPLDYKGDLLLAYRMAP